MELGSEDRDSTSTQLVIPRFKTEVGSGKCLGRLWLLSGVWFSTGVLIVDVFVWL